MSEPKIYVEIEGTPVPIEECTWVQTAPCGCECAWTVARYHPTYDDAWNTFSSSKKERERNEKRGFKVKIVRHKDIRIKDDCTHTPKWGVEPPPTPEGYSWAASLESRALHLVPVVIEMGETTSLDCGPKETIKTLCGRASAWVWSRRWYETEGLIECVSCERAALAVKA
ncbi:hypothetical protein AAI421_14650 [Rhodococcus aetherivorans]|uniref:hypothetical protein n=1 Tax=Rhodococcus aetherivorans TaxID=191292 RepID=UPI0031D63E8B